MVRTALEALHAALRPGSRADESQLRALLEDVLKTVGRGSLALQHDAENVLARLMLSAAPRSDQLLDHCISSLGWAKHADDLSPNPAVMAVLARRRDLATLANLKSGGDPLGKAFVRLSKPANPVVRWLRANTHGAKRSPEWSVITKLQDTNPQLLHELNAQEVAWWERFMSRPHLSYGLATAGLLLVVFRIVAIMARSGTAYVVLRDALTAILAWVLLLALKLYVFDWPRMLMVRRWPVGPPLLLRIGWLPVLTLGFLAFYLLFQTVRAKTEAQVLEQTFGDEYRRYRKQTWF